MAFRRGVRMKFRWLPLVALSVALAQPQDFPPPGFGPPGFGRGGLGGPGGPGQRIKILKQFDKDGDGYLNGAERKAAREYLATRPPRGFGGRGFGGPPGGGCGGAFGGGAAGFIKHGTKVESGQGH